MNTIISKLLMNGVRGLVLAALGCSASAQQAADDATPVASSPAPSSATAPVPAPSAAPALAPSTKGPPVYKPGSMPSFALDDPDRIERGKNRFANNCAAYCHGFEGSGGKTPAFRGREDLKPDDVFKTITVGRIGADVMPAWGNGFSEEKRWELVAYIMWLTRQPPREAH